MATRNILHIRKLQEFEDFLESKGYMILATSKNPLEVLRANKDNDTVIVYKKADAKEHLSTMDKDYHLVREFIKSRRVQTNADRIRQMTDEELAKIIMCPYHTEPYLCSRKECVDCCIEWLQKPVELDRK